MCTCIHTRWKSSQYRLFIPVFLFFAFLYLWKINLTFWLGRLSWGINSWHLFCLLVCQSVCSLVYRVADLRAVNKMDSTNLASIFGPILLKVDKVGRVQLFYKSEKERLRDRQIDRLTDWYIGMSEGGKIEGRNQQIMQCHVKVT